MFQSRLECEEAEQAADRAASLEAAEKAEAEKPKEIFVIHKSSKELYKALAAQLGITCKMSDHCRCYDCQVNQ